MRTSRVGPCGQFGSAGRQRHRGEQCSCVDTREQAVGTVQRSRPQARACGVDLWPGDQRSTGSLDQVNEMARAARTLGITLMPVVHSAVPAAAGGPGDPVDRARPTRPAPACRCRLRRVLDALLRPRPLAPPHLVGLVGGDWARSRRHAPAGLRAPVDPIR